MYKELYNEYKSLIASGKLSEAKAIFDKLKEIDKATPINRSKA